MAHTSNEGRINEKGIGQADGNHYWLDPQRNYIVMRWDMIVRDGNGHATVFERDTVEETARSPQGVWYATKVRRSFAGRAGKDKPERSDLSHLCRFRRGTARLAFRASDACGEFSDCVSNEPVANCLTTYSRPATVHNVLDSSQSDQGPVNAMPLLRQIAQLGHPVLYTLAKPVSFPASDANLALVGDMLETLCDANGVGIAAPRFMSLWRSSSSHRGLILVIPTRRSWNRK